MASSACGHVVRWFSALLALGEAPPISELAGAYTKRRCRTRRCSEREPADSLRNGSNVIGGWLSSLTFTLGIIRALPPLAAAESE